MEQIGRLFNLNGIVVKNARVTERGELLEYFLKEINRERSATKKFNPLPIRFIAVKLGGIPTKDLYYIKTICDDAKKRGYSFGKCFFGSLKFPAV